MDAPPLQMIVQYLLRQRGLDVVVVATVMGDPRRRRGILNQSRLLRQSVVVAAAAIAEDDLLRKRDIHTQSPPHLPTHQPFLPYTTTQLVMAMWTLRQFLNAVAIVVNTGIVVGSYTIRGGDFLHNQAPAGTYVGFNYHSRMAVPPKLSRHDSLTAVHQLSIDN